MHLSRLLTRAALHLAFVSTWLNVVSIKTDVASTDVVPPLSSALRVGVVAMGCSRPFQMRRLLNSYITALSTVENHSASASSSALPAAVEKLSLFVSIDEHRRAKYVRYAAEDFMEQVEEIWDASESSSGRAQDVSEYSVRERIALHYYRVLSRLFSHSSRFSHAILLEDDLIIAEDFLLFQLSYLPYLHVNNNTLACVSAWNDNGGAYGMPLHTDVSLTSFFPGLGWGISRTLWENQLRSTWPLVNALELSQPLGAGWDYWLRTKFETLALNCITPNIPRVRHAAHSDSANVDAHGMQGRALEEMRYAKMRVNWAHFAQKSVVTSAERYENWINELEERSVEIESLKELPSAALNDGAENGNEDGDGDGEDIKNGKYTDTSALPVRKLSFLRHDFPSLAKTLRLWCSPRGFFRGRLALRLRKRHGWLVLKERASSLREGDVEFVLAERNVSCKESCVHGCEQVALHNVNKCTEMIRRFGHVGGLCPAGCAYETGPDLPAIVESTAPILTRGACLVTEVPWNAQRGFDCSGRFEWTRRVCACRTADRKMRGMHGDGDGVEEDIPRDEL